MTQALLERNVVNSSYTGQFVASGALTPMQAKFVRVYCTNGGQGVAAALAAGYSERSVDGIAYHLSKLPHIRAAIHERLESKLNNGLAALAFKTLCDMLEAQDTPKAVKAKVAIWALEKAGHMAPKSNATPSGKPLNEMSIDELRSFVESGQKALSDLKPAIVIEADDKTAQPSIPSSSIAP